MTARTLMLAAFVALLLAACQTTGAGHGPAKTANAPYTTQSMDIDTYTPTDYRNILDGSMRTSPEAISAVLYWPKEVKRPVPAVVIMHGSGGIRDSLEGALAEYLASHGLAALLVDSFTGRGISSTAGNQGRLSIAGSVMDGFAALQALRKIEGIDPERIGITGHSRGGVAAIHTAHEGLRAAALGNAKGYLAHVPIAPGCGTQWQTVQATGAPMLFLLGADDDLTPAAKCLTYAEKFRQAGAPVDVKVFPESGHNFMTTEASSWAAGVTNFAKCDLEITAEGQTVYTKLGIALGSDFIEFATAVVRDCATSGFTAGGNAGIRKEATQGLINFFREAFGMKGTNET